MQATVFAVIDCGYAPRCALEISNSGEVRIDKIFKLVEGCRYGLHDLSRTEVDATSGLPRFNMPLELGIFLGAQRYGPPLQRRKNCLILDRERYRYQQFISDIAGQDIAAHGGVPARLIAVVRDWLSAADPAGPLPGGNSIAARFARFRADLGQLCDKLRLDVGSLTFADYTNVVAEWLRRDLVATTSRGPD